MRIFSLPKIFILKMGKKHIFVHCGLPTALDESTSAVLKLCSIQFSQHFSSARLKILIFDNRSLLSVYLCLYPWFLYISDGLIRSKYLRKFSTSKFDYAGILLLRIIAFFEYCGCWGLRILKPADVEYCEFEYDASWVRPCRSEEVWFRNGFCRLGLSGRYSMQVVPIDKL